MIHTRLFEDVLIEPAIHGANKLYIISGYATSAMAFHHLNLLANRNILPEVHLLIGMSSVDGISESNHMGFKNLMENSYRGNFFCSYVFETPPVHSKVYSWYQDDRPVSGYAGSANYTQIAFSDQQRETMEESDPGEGFDYFSDLEAESIYCIHPDSESIVQIYNDNNYRRVIREENALQEQDGAFLRNSPSLAGLPHVCFSLLDRNGRLPQRSGLNWGQRPEEHREPNQAYIKLPSSVYNTDFFPGRTVHFTVLTDDGMVLICTRAQDNGKAIHTPHNNSLIGEYFRNRLNLPNGSAVSLGDLQRYGRTDVCFYKIDDETYFMDFAAHRNG